MKIIDTIDSFISGDWGNETLTDETPCKVSCIRGADIVPIESNDFSHIPTRYISKQSLDNKCLQAGDIIVEKSGGSPTQSTGRVSFVSQELIDSVGNVVCSNFCVAFRVKQGWNSLYIYYYLQYMYNNGVFFNFEGKTSGIKNLQLEAAYNAVPIKDVDIAIQDTVVSVLDSFHKKITLNHAINQNLEALTKQLYDYWFVQFDFPNEEGKPYKSSGGKMVWNEMLKREIPFGWESVPVKHVVFPIERGISYSSVDIASPNGYPMINLACYSKQGDYRVNELKFFSGKIREEDKVLPYDLLIACTDMTQGADVIGRPILATEEYEWFVYSMDLAKITPKEIGKMYLYYTLRTPFYHKYIKPFASGTTVKHLNLQGVENYKIPVPSVFLQNRFEEVITPIKCQQMLALNEINALTKQRNELLPLLMNGQVTIK